MPCFVDKDVGELALTQAGQRKPPRGDQCHDHNSVGLDLFQGSGGLAQAGDRFENLGNLALITGGGVVAEDFRV